MRKLRLVAILLGLGALALVSTVFGMMMAVASDLPQLENREQYKRAANSFLYDDHWRPIGIFAPPDNVVIDRPSDIAPIMQHAIIAVEDKRFASNPGVDLRGLARAFVTDVAGRGRQGGSTIAEQFVKNALSEQANRTIFEKLREATLAYHLARKWSKAKILTEYLNSIYFGSGAYGIESAARVYFGRAHRFLPQAGLAATPTSGVTPAGCGDGSLPRCAAVLRPWEAALLAGMVSDPAAYDPVQHPRAARRRRNLVLRDMRDQGYISAAQYAGGIAQPVPTAVDLQQPAEPTAAPYFTSWLRPQVLAAVGLGRGVPSRVAEYRAYYGGLRIRTTLDLRLQQAADQAISADLPYTKGGPAVSLVAIDNHTGEVRAMVGGPVIAGHENFERYPFNLATQGHRQPGSSFKPFTLAVALESGYTGNSLLTSAPVSFVVPHSGGREHFVVHNFAGAYSGTISLYNATAVSDNSVYARLGIEGLHNGTQRIASLAHRMGVRSPLSTNDAMILGGLREGVTPLDMAHAYETFATGGNRVFNPVLGTPEQGPTGIAEIQCYLVACGGQRELIDHPQYERVLPTPIARAVHDILTGVVQLGTGTKASIAGVDVVGKTGTTSNYGDAWFVGWTPEITVAVWVGVPDRLVSMATNYNGQPVEGGTFPAIIWHDFVSAALPILASEKPPSRAPAGTPPASPAVTYTTAPALTSTAPAVTTAPAAPPTAGAAGSAGGGPAGTSGAAATPGTAGPPGTGAGGTGAGPGAGTGAAGTGAGGTGRGGGTPTGGGGGTGAGTGAGTGGGTSGGAGLGGAGG